MQCAWEDERVQALIRTNQRHAVFVRKIMTHKTGHHPTPLAPVTHPVIHLQK
jgi:hypothetical protein